MYFEREKKFSPSNVQPESQTKLPSCPSYILIEICAILAGINSETLATDDHFCGHQVEYEDTIGPLSGFRGNNYRPITKCTEIRDCLIEMLHQAQEDVLLPREGITETVESNGDPLKKEQLLKQALEQTIKYNEKQRILSLWRTAVYEISCVPPDPSQRIDPHFRRRTIEELTDEEVIGTVRIFCKALEDQVTGKGSNWYKGSLIFDGSRARHCPQTPRFEKIGTSS